MRKPIVPRPNNVARLVRLYADCTPAERAAGAAWYPAALGHAARIGRRYGYNPDAVAGVIAALSPNKPWGENLRIARLACAGHRDGFRPEEVSLTFPEGKRRAWAILSGVHPLDVLSGAKVTAFYRAIAGDPDAVTIDRWAWLAAAGRPVAGTPSAREYATLQAEYTEAAAIAGVPARDFQAAVWVHVRGRIY